MKRFIIFSLFFITFFSCKTTNIENSLDKSSNNPEIIDGKFIYRKVSDSEWEIKGVKGIWKLYVSGVDANNKRDISFIVNDKEIKLETDQYGRLDSDNLWDYPKSTKIQSFMIKSTKKIFFDKINVSRFLGGGQIQIDFTNLNLGRYDDSYLLAKLGVNLKNEQIVDISKGQINNLLNNNPKEFYGNSLGSKTELQWKAFWKTEEGKDYLNLFEKTRKKLLNEHIYTKVNVNYDNYDIKKGCFTINFGDNRCGGVYRVYPKNSFYGYCPENFKTKVTIAKHDNYINYEKYSYDLIVSESEALKIEDNKRNVYTRLKFKIKELKSINYPGIELYWVDFSRGIYDGKSRTFSDDFIITTDTYLEFVNKETEEVLASCEL